MLDTFIEIIQKYDSNEYSDKQLGDIIRDSTTDYVDQYLSWTDAQQLVEEKENEAGIRKLVLLLLACQAILGQNSMIDMYNEDQKFRISALSKIIIRANFITDDNIDAFRKGRFLTSIVNCRTLYETFVLLHYLDISGEIEADRFQDFAIFQESEIRNNNSPKLLALRAKYKDEFFQNYGWISKTNDRNKSFSSIVKTIKETKYYSWYALASNFVHASPFSIESLLNKNNKDGDLKLIKTEYLISYNTELLHEMMDYFVDNYILENKDIYRFMLLAIENAINTK